jgi:2'-5' RNA ligase
VRLFVAIELSPEWLTALDAVQSRMKAALESRGAPRLRWVRPEGIHLTLKFLGEVTDARLPSVLGALDSATQPPPDFSLNLAGMGSFGDRRGPRVVWAGVDGRTENERKKLYDLVGRIETWSAAAGFPRERGFSPHLTLARLPEKMTADERRLVAVVTAAEAPKSLAPLVVDSICLMRSHLGSGGARYERIEAFPRGGR